MVSKLPIALFAGLCAALLLSSTAGAKIYGGNPLNISTPANGSPADGPSGEPVISGDNRFSRLVAFSSSATNLVGGDTNGETDVFVWKRPNGKLSKVGAGTLELVSTGGNDDSKSPSIDGSMRKAPHCVAFQSQATNFVAGDLTTDWDIYVKDLRTGAIKLASAGIAGDAVTPALSGDCKEVAFAAGGNVYRSAAKTWTTLGSNAPTAKLVGAGDQPHISLEGTTIVWRAPGNQIKFLTKGKRAKTVGSGSNPRASDKDRLAGWGVTFQSGSAVISRKLNKRGRVATRARIPNAVFGGSTAYVPNRGIIIFAKAKSFYYFNANSGNSDDLAHANVAITEMASSARGTVMAFAAAGGDKDFIDTKPFTSAPTVITTPGLPIPNPDCPDPTGPTGSTDATGPTSDPVPCEPTIPGPPVSETIPGKTTRFQAVYVKTLPVKGCGSGC